MSNATHAHRNESDVYQKGSMPEALVSFEPQVSASAPPVHAVQFYDTQEALIDRLCGIVCSGLLIGNSVLIIATEDHRNHLTTALQRLEVNLRTYAREKRFAMYDADGFLATFMVNDLPDLKRFLSSFGDLLTTSKKARSTDQGFTVFSEMVSVLWKQGNKAGALALERLWNELLNERAIHLHCAYPRAIFSQHDADFSKICDAHSHVLMGW
jgi:DcmR-like sensory protein